MEHYDQRLKVPNAFGTSTYYAQGREVAIPEGGRRAEIVDADALEAAVEESGARVVTGGGQLVPSRRRVV